MNLFGNIFIVFLAVFKFGNTLLTNDKLTEENWRGKNTQQPLNILTKPDIKMRKNSFSILDGKKQVFIRNTCAINCYIHGFSLIFFEKNGNFETSSLVDNFKNIVKTTTSQASSKNENDKLVYEFLVHELKEIIKIKDSEIDCYTGVISVLDRILCINFQSICNECGATKKNKYVYKICFP